MNANQVDRKERWQHVLPEFAPLSFPLVKFLFAHSEKFDFVKFSYNENDTLFDQIWANTQITRGNVLGYVHPVMLAPTRAALDARLSITWFSKALQGFDPLHRYPPRQTIANWQTRNLLRTRGFGVPEPNSASALLVMRALSSLGRDWLPGDIEQKEPWFWVWGQKPGQVKPEIYPWPLPDNLDANIALYTTWRGAAWLPGWKSVRHYGAIAWSKTAQCRNHLCWNLSEAEMAAWDNDFVEGTHLIEQPLSLPGFSMVQLENDEYDLLRLHALADELLSRIGEPLLYSHLKRFYSQRLLPACIS